MNTVSGGSLTFTPNSASNTTSTETVHITTASNLLPGQGLPVGVPIRMIGINAGSGTASTWNNFAKSGGSSSVNCGSGPPTDNFNANAAQGANPQSPQGESGNLEIAVENDNNQVGDFANADWGSSDGADQAVDIATSLSYMGNGAYRSNANASIASVETSSPTSFVATQLDANNTGDVGGVQTSDLRNNAFPTDRTLFNVIRTDTVRASTGGFINWMCDGGATLPINGATISPMVTKGTDHINGGNFDDDLTTIINNQYDYSRLTDTSQENPLSSEQTQNGVTNLNGTCEATQSIATSGTPPTVTGIALSNTVVTLSGPVPSTIQPGWSVYVPAGFALETPAQRQGVFGQWQHHHANRRPGGRNWV